MSLARLFPSLSLTLIRKLGDAGGPRADQVSKELDNIIAWAKASPRCIQRDTSLVNSAGVGPDVLHTFSLPANSLATDGDYLSVWYAGGFGVSARTKAVQAQFDGTSYENGGVQDIASSTGWVLMSRIIRTSATSVRTSHFLLENLMGITSAPSGSNTVVSFNFGSFLISRNTSFTVANLNSNAVTMRVRSVVNTGAVAGDVFQNQSIIELCQQ